MELIRKEKDGDILLKIEGAMSIYNAPALREELAACFEQHKGIALDLGEVKECDAAGIQILCSAWKSSAVSGRSFVVSRSSSSVDDAFLRAGLNKDEFQNLDKEKSDG